MSILSKSEEQELIRKGFLSEIDCPHCDNGTQEYYRTPDSCVTYLDCERCEGTGRIGGFFTHEDISELSA